MAKKWMRKVEVIDVNGTPYGTVSDEHSTLYMDGQTIELRAETSPGALEDDQTIYYTRNLIRAKVSNFEIEIEEGQSPKDKITRVALTTPDTPELR